MRYVIAIIAKTPHPQFRYNRVKREWQDWYRHAIKAVEIFKSLRVKGYKVTIVVATSFCPFGKNEFSYYKEALNQLGVKSKNIVSIGGNDTVTQIDELVKWSRRKRDNIKIITVSSLLHWPRVCWIFKQLGIKNTSHRIALGMPMPKEFITDPVMFFIVVFLDIFKLDGMKKKLLKTIQERRDQEIL